MKGLLLTCPECGSALKKELDNFNCIKGHSFKIEKGVYNLLPHSMIELTKKDAEYHETLIDDWENQAQVNVFRNSYFHKKIADFICKRSNDKSNILELAGGVGYDLLQFSKLKPKFCNYVFSEISEKMSAQAAMRTKNDRVSFFCIDAHSIPFADEQFDFIYTISSFHHFSNMDKALQEIIRVTKKGGFIIFGIEPNRHWFSLISKLKKPLRKFLPRKMHSIADDETEGFFVKELEDIAKDYSISLLGIEPIWFFNGFIHYMLDFLYKLFRFKNKIQLPLWIGKIFTRLDEALSTYHILRQYSWHYTAIYKKNV